MSSEDAPDILALLVAWFGEPSAAPNPRYAGWPRRRKDDTTHFYDLAFWPRIFEGQNAHLAAVLSAHIVTHFHAFAYTATTCESMPVRARPFCNRPAFAIEFTSAPDRGTVHECDYCPDASDERTDVGRLFGDAGTRIRLVATGASEAKSCPSFTRPSIGFTYGSVMRDADKGRVPAAVDAGAIRSATIKNAVHRVCVMIRHGLHWLYQMETFDHMESCAINFAVTRFAVSADDTRRVGRFDIRVDVTCMLTDDMGNEVEPRVDERLRSLSRFAALPAAPVAPICAPAASSPPVAAAMLEWRAATPSSPPPVSGIVDIPDYTHASSGGDEEEEEDADDEEDDDMYARAQAAAAGDPTEARSRRQIYAASRVIPNTPVAPHGRSVSQSRPMGRGRKALPAAVANLLGANVRDRSASMPACSPPRLSKQRT